jgi:D-aminoacyl-tRNA deacylase
MKALVQRVTRASVSVDDGIVGQIAAGLLILVGVGRGDGADDALRLAQKVAELRIFADGDGKFNRSLIETGGAALVVSQFTLLAVTRRGRRPSFSQAATPEDASPLISLFASTLRERGITVETGRFGAHMLVSLENDGPVTILLESEAGG